MQVAHPQSGSSSTWFLIELEFGNVGFWGEGKTGVPGEKPLGAKERTNNKLNPHMASTPGFEPGSHWWEASALTTAPPLLPYANKDTWLGTDKQFKSKNCNRLCFQLFKFVTIRWIKMVKGNEVCLAFVGYAIGFENIRHFVLVPRPQWKRILFPDV